MDNPDPEAVPDVQPAESDARRRRDAGLPPREGHPAVTGTEEHDKKKTEGHEDRDRT